MKKIIIALFCIILMSFHFDEPFISNDDLNILQGEKWTGNLTYKDYGNGKQVNIPANLSVSKSTDVSGDWIFSYEYPDEPHANSIDTISILDGGKNFDGETVIGRSVTPEGYVKIVTTKTIENKNKRFTYVISEKYFSAKNEEQGPEDTDFIQRNIYVFNR